MRDLAFMASPPPRRILLAAFPDVEVLDVTGPASVFSAAHELRPPGHAGYQVEVAAARPGTVPTSSGVGLVAETGFAEVKGPVDTLIVPGGIGTVRAERDPAMHDLLGRFAPEVRRVASVCTGSFVLAERGLLAGRRATTHWSATEAFAKRHPDVELEPDAIWTRDGRFFTSAGVTAGIDLALALVEDDLGTDTAMAVARMLVVYLKRPGGQAQFSVGLQAQSAATGPLDEAPSYIAEHLDADLSVSALASRFAMSPRHFARVFAASFGVPPAKYVERARVERARVLLEDLARSVDDVATEVGFASAERMRRTFQRHLHVAPSDYRERFRSTWQDSAPAPPPLSKEGIHDVR